MNSPLKWMGGKGNMLKLLLLYVPEHKLYVECFGGAATLLFAKPQVPLEVYNDLESNLVNFFRILRDKEKFEKLKLKLLFTPYSLEEFLIAKKECKNEELNDVDKAYYFYIVVRQAYNSDGSWSYGSVKTNRNQAKSYFNSLLKLDDIYERFMNVQVDHRDFRTVIPAYDGNDTFMYMDPPYMVETVGKDKHIYKYMMSDSDHEDLIELLKNMKSKVMLSGYRTALYDSLLEHHWIRKDFEVTAHSALKNKEQRENKDEEYLVEKRKRVESIWMNYELDK